MNIEKVIVPDSIGDGVGRLNYKDGKVVSYERGSVVNVYLFHETDGENVRAMELTMAAPMTYEKCLNAAEMSAYGLVTAMDVASFAASLARKQRVNEDTGEVAEHDAFMASVKIELARLGIAGSVIDELEAAKRQKIAELDAYNNSSNVNEFTVSGLPMWLTFDERTRLHSAVNAKAAKGETVMTKNWGGYDFTFSTEQWTVMLFMLEDYAYECQNTTDRHKAAILLLQSVQAVEEYDFTVGYPERLRFEV